MVVFVGGGALPWRIELIGKGSEHSSPPPTCACGLAMASGLGGAGGGGPGVATSLILLAPCTLIIAAIMDVLLGRR